MWGRASISSPVKVTKQKLKDPYNLHTESDFTNAMDMLTFASNPAASNGVTLRTTATPTVVAAAVPDPFRELILMSDQRPDTHDPHYFAGLQQLANKAFDLVEQTLKTQPQLAKKMPVPEVGATAPAAPVAAAGVAAAQPAKPATPALPVPMASNLTNLFQDPKDIVDPKKLEEFMNMLAEVETEESDSGGPILGKLSLAKRTHNALSKADIKRSPNYEGQSNMSSVWGQQLPDLNTLAVGYTHKAGAAHIEPLQGFNFEETVAEEVLTIEQEADVETEDGNGGADSEDLPTAEQVHATMKQFHLRKCQPAQDEAAHRAKSARIRRRNK